MSMSMMRKRTGMGANCVCMQKISGVLLEPFHKLKLGTRQTNKEVN